MNKELKEEIMNLLAEAECKLYYFQDENNNSDYEEIREDLKKVMEKFYNKCTNDRGNDMKEIICKSAKEYNELYEQFVKKGLYKSGNSYDCALFCDAKTREEKILVRCVYVK